MRISDWSSDVCSSDLAPVPALAHRPRRGHRARLFARLFAGAVQELAAQEPAAGRTPGRGQQRRGGAPGEEVRRCRSDRRRERRARLRNESRSEEHTSELQSLMRILYAVYYLEKKKTLIT